MTNTEQTPGRLTSRQTDFLLTPISPKRVRMLRGMSHVEAWDVRRQLIRIFGFEGFTTETLALDLVAERESKGKDRSRWTVVYRAQVRLIIRDVTGKTVTYWDDAAAGDAQNQPSLGDAHDQAMKTALSQALKRCAVNLGDQFGLSLYSDGSKDAVVMRSLAYLGDPVPDSEDAQVQAEPVPETLRSVDPVSEAEAPQREYLREAYDAPDADTVRKIWLEARAAAAVPEYLEQIAEVGKQKAAATPGPTDEHAAAVADLRAAADAAHLDDFENGAEQALGAPIADAPAEHIRALAAQLRNAA